MSYCQTLSIELIKAIPFLVIGGITVYIAWRQYKVEKLRLQIERSEKRFIIFKKVNRLFWLYGTNDSITNFEFIQFTGGILQRHFVFSKKLNKKIQKLELFIIEFGREQAEKRENSEEINSKMIKLLSDIMVDIVAESKIV